MILKTIFIYSFTYYFCAYGMNQPENNIKEKSIKSHIKQCIFKKKTNQQDDLQQEESINDFFHSFKQDEEESKNFFYGNGLHKCVYNSFLNKSLVVGFSKESVENYIKLIVYKDKNIEYQNFKNLIENILKDENLTENILKDENLTENILKDKNLTENILKIKNYQQIQEEVNILKLLEKNNEYKEYIEKEKYILGLLILCNYYLFEKNFLIKYNITIDENYYQKDLPEIKNDFYTIITKVLELEKNNILEREKENKITFSKSQKKYILYCTKKQLILLKDILEIKEQLFEEILNCKIQQILHEKQFNYYCEKAGLSTLALALSYYPVKVGLKIKKEGVDMFKKIYQDIMYGKKNINFTGEEYQSVITIFITSLCLLILPYVLLKLFSTNQEQQNLFPGLQGINQTTSDIDFLITQISQRCIYFNDSKDFVNNLNNAISKIENCFNEIKNTIKSINTEETSKNINQLVIQIKQLIENINQNNLPEITNVLQLLQEAIQTFDQKSQQSILGMLLKGVKKGEQKK
jgi:hypothetical protein